MALKMQKATKMQTPRVNKTQSAKPASAPKPKYKIEKSGGMYYYKTGGGVDAKGTRYTDWKPWDPVKKQPMSMSNPAPSKSSSGKKSSSSSGKSDNRGSVKPVSTAINQPTATAVTPSGTFTL